MTDDPTETVSAKVARLRRLDACAVSDALDHFGLSGVLDSVAPVTGPVRIAGRVVTVELGPASAIPATRHLATAAVMAAGPDDLIVVAHQGRSDSAGWGGNLSRAAKRRGVAGTIVHGHVRDVDESRDIGYSVFANGSTPRTARGRTEERAWGGPITLGDLEVATGDFGIGDSTGVAFVRGVDIDRVLAKAESIVDRESQLASAIDLGEPVDDVMGRSYEAMVGGTADE
jgi:regulator of RNase E activity RraA